MPNLSYSSRLMWSVYDLLMSELLWFWPVVYSWIHIWCDLFIFDLSSSPGLYMMRSVYFNLSCSYLTWFVYFTFMFTWIHIWYGQFIFNLGFFGSIFVMSRLCLTCHVVVNSYLIRLLSCLSCSPRFMMCDMILPDAAGLRLSRVLLNPCLVWPVYVYPVVSSWIYTWCILFLCNLSYPSWSYVYYRLFVPNLWLPSGLKFDASHFRLM